MIDCRTATTSSTTCIRFRIHVWIHVYLLIFRLLAYTTIFILLASVHSFQGNTCILPDILYKYIYVYVSARARVFLCVCVCVFLQDGNNFYNDVHSFQEDGATWTQVSKYHHLSITFLGFSDVSLFFPFFNFFSFFSVCVVTRKEACSGSITILGGGVVVTSLFFSWWVFPLAGACRIRGATFFFRLVFCLIFLLAASAPIASDLFALAACSIQCLAV